MIEAIDNPIEIREGSFAHDNTNIMPVKKEKGFSYKKKNDEQISICCYYLEGHIEKLLNKYFSTEIQLEEAVGQKEYNEFGWNFYTPEQIKCILKELNEYLSCTDEPIRMKDFYSRFIIRMERMLNNMDGYDLILFCGP